MLIPGEYPKATDTLLTDASVHKGVAVPTSMDEVARITGENTPAVALSARHTIAVVTDAMVRKRCPIRPL